MRKSRGMRQDKLRRAWRERTAQIPPRLVRLGRAVWDEGDDKAAHKECVAALPAFVSAEVEGQRVAELYPETQRHLDRCSSCAAQYVDLLQVAMADVGNALPHPGVVPAPNLSFLTPPVAMRKLVLESAERVLTKLSPQPVTGLQIIADVFFEEVQALGGRFTLQAMEVRGAESGMALEALALSYVATESLVSTVTTQEVDEGIRSGIFEQAVETRAYNAGLEIGLDSATASMLAKEFAAQVAKYPASLKALIE
jgi:hypothetical protein